MSLTNDDKTWIKGAIVDGVTEALDTIVMPQFDRLETEFKHETSSIRRDIAHLQFDVDEVKGKLEAIENDIKEIYDMVTNLQAADEKNTKDVNKLRQEVEKYIRATDQKLHKLAAASGVVL